MFYENWTLYKKFKMNVRGWLLSFHNIFKPSSFYRCIMHIYTMTEYLLREKYFNKFMYAGRMDSNVVLPCSYYDKLESLILVAVSWPLDAIQNIIINCIRNLKYFLLHNNGCPLLTYSIVLYIYCINFFRDVIFYTSQNLNDDHFLFKY